MKKYLFFLILGFTTCKLQAQTQKITIYASFQRSNCMITYLNYDKLYPDSVKAAVMIDYQKKYQLKKTNTGVLLLRMNLDGWKLITIARTSGLEYLLSKEIFLNDAAMELYLQNLQHLNNDNNDTLPF